MKKQSADCCSEKNKDFTLYWELICLRVKSKFQTTSNILSWFEKLYSSPEHKQRSIIENCFQILNPGTDVVEGFQEHVKLIREGLAAWYRGEYSKYFSEIAKTLIEWETYWLKNEEKAFARKYKKTYIEVVKRALQWDQASILKIIEWDLNWIWVEKVKEYIQHYEKEIEFRRTLGEAIKRSGRLPQKLTRESKERDDFILGMIIISGASPDNKKLFPIIHNELTKRGEIDPDEFIEKLKDKMLMPLEKKDITNMRDALDKIPQIISGKYPGGINDFTTKYLKRHKIL